MPIRLLSVADTGVTTSLKSHSRGKIIKDAGAIKISFSLNPKVSTMFTTLLVAKHDVAAR